MSTVMVLVCALELLGRSAAALPPIELVAGPPPGAAANVEAFVRAGSGVISLGHAYDAGRPGFSAPARRSGRCPAMIARPW